MKNTDVQPIIDDVIAIKEAVQNGSVAYVSIIAALEDIHAKLTSLADTAVADVEQAA